MFLQILFSATCCYSDDGVEFDGGNSHGDDDDDDYVADDEEDHLELNTIAK